MKIAHVIFLIFLSCNAWGQGISPGSGKPGGWAPLTSQSLTPLNLQSSPSSQRPPGGIDDTTNGYSINNLWLAPNGSMWQAQRVTAGKAMWQRTGVSPQIGNAGLPSPTLAYGVCIVIPGYGGATNGRIYTNPLMQLTRASDSTTLSLYPLVSNNCVDAASGDAFCSGTSCTITTWYDQSSNALDCVAPAVTNAALWTPSKTINGNRVFSLASVAHALTNLPATQLYCTIPVGFSWNPSSVSWLGAGQMWNAKGEIRTIFETADTTRGFINAFGNSGMSVTGTGRVSTTTIESRPSIFGVSVSSTIMQTFADNISASVGFSSQSGFTGAHLGGSLTNFTTSDMDLLAFVVWTSTLTAPQITTGISSLSAQFGIPLQTDDSLFIIGDSMSMGNGSSLGNTWPQLSLPLLSNTTRLYNMAQSGSTCAGQIAGFSAFYGSTDATTNAHNQNFLAMTGVNDIRVPTPVTTIEACLQTLVSDVHNLGANRKIIIGTTPLQCDIFGNPTQLAAFKTLMDWIRANWNVAQSSGGLGSDGLADFQADPTVGPGNYASSAFCGFPNTISPDGDHPTDLAMSYLATVGGAAVNALPR